jgi:hypothetical protein
MGTEYQKEFFNEFKKEKGKFKKIADKITRRQPKFYVHLSLENIVFTAIIGIMCIVTAFAIGVERGKRLVPAAADSAYRGEPAREEAAAAKDGPAVTGEKEVLTNKEGALIIQLISYKKKELALKEKKRLLNKKINAFIIPSGKWYRVCAGGYVDMKAARSALEVFKKDYKGCFIRKKGE